MKNVSLSADWRRMACSEAKQQAKQRFRERKYGMFIHWGLFAVPGGVWKGKTMEEGGSGPAHAEWIMRRKEIPRSEYAELASEFNPTAFNAGEWVALAKLAGMRYIVITSKHHDGFAMFDSAASDFNVVKATPFARDVIGELEQACREAGLGFGVYYSHSLDWRDGGDGGAATYSARIDPVRESFPNTFDPSPCSFDEYITCKSIPQVAELLDRYHPEQIWFDTPLYIPEKYSHAFYKMVYEMDPEILVNARIGNGMGDIGTPGDNEIPANPVDPCWEGIATTNNSWGYSSYDTDWKSPSEVLYWLIATVSKGGNFLLNVGPDARGIVPAPAAATLRQVGEWLKTNGDAVYGTYPWIVSHEGPTEVELKGTDHRSQVGFSCEFTQGDFWFTQKDDRIYVMALVPPSDNQITVASLAHTKVLSARILGESVHVTAKVQDNGVHFQWPPVKSRPLGYVLEVIQRFH